MSEMSCPKCESGNVCGMEIQRVYDGALYWFCQDCDWAWARDWSGYGRRQQFCDEYVEKHNARSK